MVRNLSLIALPPYFTYMKKPKKTILPPGTYLRSSDTNKLERIETPAEKYHRKTGGTIGDQGPMTFHGEGPIGPMSTEEEGASQKRRKKALRDEFNRVIKRT